MEKVGEDRQIGARKSKNGFTHKLKERKQRNTFF